MVPSVLKEKYATPAFDWLQLNTETPPPAPAAKWKKANNTIKIKLRNVCALVCKNHPRNSLNYRFLGLTPPTSNSVDLE